MKHPAPDVRELADRIYDEVAARLRHRRIPSSVYRVQLSQACTLQAASKLVPYLDELGICDVYTSPYLHAAPGSTHGYDVVAHDSIDPEMGGEEGLALLAAALHARGMGHLVDLVPNHMSISSENQLWQDVLENGPSSTYAPFFDVVWKPVKDELENKVLLPVLGDQYGAVLEAGDLRLKLSQGTFFICYFEHRFPINPRHYPMILRHRMERLEEELPPNDVVLEELLSICTACDNLPPRTETDPEKVEERRREKEVVKRRLDTLCKSSPAILAFVEASVDAFNGEQGDPHSFDLLDKLLDEQAYRLAHWRVAGEEINYRRFFDINELAAIRMEDPRVFEQTHRLVLRLLADGIVQGLRIDHPDGLFDPKTYFERIQEQHFVEVCRRLAEGDGAPVDLVLPLVRARFEAEAVRTAASRPVYVVAEKVLGLGETVPEGWPIDGTTGYEFMNTINGLFVQAESRRAIDDVYSRFTGLRLQLEELLYEKKKLIMSTSMASEVNMLAYQLNLISETNRRSRDFTLNSLRSALIEYVASFPVYRSYVSEEGVDERDRRYIERAIARAKRRSPVVNVTIFDFLRNVLLARHGGHLSEDERSRRLDFAMKLQQLTGPVMAKALEDTCFYIYNRLVSLNEVGGEPRQFGVGVADFHAQSIERLETARGSLLATTTHDTKRSEDVRARIDVLSEVPGEWKAALYRLSKAARKHRIKLAEDRIAPDRNEEYLLYQTLIGAWPFGDLDGGQREEFTGRIAAYLLKAAKEAKVETSWINPDTAWDEALGIFVRRILSDDHFIQELLPFQRRVAEVGIRNSLAQTLLKIASPGVPDIYQGCEQWCFTLVDPDNRRTVDFHAMARDLSALREAWEAAGDDPRRLAQELWEARHDGRVKHFITWRALDARRRRPELFLDGDYVPVECAGPRGDRAVAFSRRRGSRQAIAVAPRLVAPLVDEEAAGEDPWAGTYLLLPGGAGGTSWRCSFTGEVHRPVLVRGSPTLPLSRLFGTLPVTLLQPA